MPKPESKPTAFSSFCREWIVTKEKENLHFTMAEATSNPECDQAWREMPEDQKARYRAIAEKGNLCAGPNERIGSSKPLCDLECAQRKEEEHIDDVSDFLASSTRGAMEHNRIQKLIFHLIHTNLKHQAPLESDELELYPSEICVARCSLESGVEDVFHVLVNGLVLKGCRSEANVHCQNTHEIPVDLKDGPSNFQDIFRDLCDFLKPDTKNNMLPHLYTVWASDDMPCSTKSILDRLAEAGGQRQDYLRLYSLEELFGLIYRAVIDRTDAQYFQNIVATFVYDILLLCSNACLNFFFQFHKANKAGAPYCSQSIVKRWFYVLCDLCCDALNITRIPGVHTPRDDVPPIEPISSLNDSMSTMSLSDSRRSGSIMMFKKLAEMKERQLGTSVFSSDVVDDHDYTLDSAIIDYSEHSFPCLECGFGHGKPFYRDIRRPGAPHLRN